jgi:type IV pilus assembly protein PilV
MNARRHLPLRPRRRAARGIALIEVLVAVVLLGIGLLGAVGLQARSYSALADTAMRAEATIAADKLIGVMTTDQANMAAYARAAGGTVGPRLLPWYTETMARIPGAVITVAVTAAAAPEPARVAVTIGWTRKSGGQANTQTVTSYLAPAL